MVDHPIYRMLFISIGRRWLHCGIVTRLKRKENDGTKIEKERERERERERENVVEYLTIYRQLIYFGCCC